MNIHLKNNWHEINWRKVYALVSKLQSQIVGGV
jgi:hypothetical protein